MNQREFREIGRGVTPVAGEVGLAVDLWGRRSGRCRRHTRKLRERGQSGVVTYLRSPVGPDSLHVQVLVRPKLPTIKDLNLESVQRLPAEQNRLQHPAISKGVPAAFIKRWVCRKNRNPCRQSRVVIPLRARGAKDCARRIS